MLCVLDRSILISEHPARIEGEIAISVVSISALQFGVLVTPDDDQRMQSGSALVGDERPQALP